MTRLPRSSATIRTALDDLLGENPAASHRFVRGVVAGAVVGAIIAGSTRLRREPRVETLAAPGPGATPGPAPASVGASRDGTEGDRADATP